MVTPLELGIIALAAWRLAYALVYEDVFAWLRERVNRQVATDEPAGWVVTTRIPTADSHYEPNLESWVKKRPNSQSGLIPPPRWPLQGVLAQLFGCVYCTSFWTGLLFYALWTVGAEPVVIVFAIAGGAVLVDKWHG